MNKNKTVVGDLIGRLESHLSDPLKRDFPLVEESAEKRKYPDIDLSPPPVEPTEKEPQQPEGEPVFKLDTKPYEALKKIVDTFNRELELWHDLTGCVVNFGWNYSNGKQLEITGIDYIIYRKTAPSEESIKSALAKAKL